MCATAPIAPVGTTQCSELIAHEMFIAGATMATAAENADLIYEITFLQNLTFTVCPL